MSDSAAYKRAKKLRVATLGECSRCSAPAVAGKSMCQHHLADQRAYSTALYHRKRGHRQCAVCSVWGHNRTNCPVRRRKLSIAADARQGEQR